MNKSRNKNQISGTCQKYQSCHSFFSFPAILKKIKKLTISNKIYLILLSGFFFAISFPTTWCGFKLPNFGWLVWVALIPLLIAIEKDNFKKIFQKTFLFASVFTFITLSWILTVLYKNAGYPLWTSFLCLVFIVFVIGLYIGIGFVGAKYISNKTGVPSYITIPIAWVIAEYITNFWPLGGFPWTNLGYSQQYNLYLIQSADIFGILGISFLIILVNALLYEVIGSFKNANYRHVYIHVTAVVIIILCNITYGAIRIALIERNHADTKSSLKVVAIPGNISQDQKWDPRFSQSIINRYRDETYKTASLEPDLIIWPETALSYYLNRHSDVIPSSIVPRLSIPILFGSMMIDPKDKTKQWNSAILSDQGREVSRYDKNHLVPLAEYIPFEFPFIKQAFAANIETQHGKELIPFQIKEHLFGVQICFEDVFPALTRKWLQKGVSFIINLSNMGWYANSSGVFQHRAYSIFRAIENRIFFIKVTNQGTSLVVNPAGIPIQELEQTKDKTWIDVSFSPKKYFSLYRLWGDFPIWILILLFSIGIFVSRFKEGVKMKLLFKPFQIYLKKIGILSIALTIVLFAKASLADSSSEYTAMDYYSNGEAVDLADGGITLQYTDLILSGKGGMDLKVSRS